MGLENFTLNMSQESCHLFAGYAVGQYTSIMYVLVGFCLTVIFAAAMDFLRPVLKRAGEKLRDKMMGRD
jgi:hypothetical protein